LGACGEAGAVSTNDGDLAAKIRKLRDHGQSVKYHHEIEGYNGRLDTIQAAILLVKLNHLPEWNCQRRKKAESYQELLSSLDGLILPFEPTWARAVYHLYAIRVKVRSEMQEHLKAAGIGTGIHYPIPLHLQPAYFDLGYREGDFPITEKVAPEILSLPMYPQLTRNKQETVVQAVKECLSNTYSIPSL